MLSNKTALIVEREMLIVLDIERMLSDMRIGRILTVRGAEQAHALDPVALDPATLDLAVIDVSSAADEAAFDLVGRLAVQGIPVVVTSPDARLARGIPDHPAISVVLKPFSEDEFVIAVTGALEGSNPTDQ